MPAAAAAATAAATSTFTASVITANIIDQTFTIFFGRREPPLLVLYFKPDPLVESARLCYTPFGNDRL